MVFQPNQDKDPLSPVNFFGWKVKYLVEW
jgi:hypothetical protein